MDTTTMTADGGGAKQQSTEKVEVVRVARRRSNRRGRYRGTGLQQGGEKAR
jgi:hypothetical protein